MSYCVNCGVELEKGCPSCPLCDTPVINPREMKTEAVKPVYPENLSIPKSLSKKYWVFVFSLVMLIPNLVLIILNSLVFDSGVVKYIVGGFVVAWIWFLFPLLWKKPIPVILLAIDALALLSYLDMFKIYGDDAGGWFNSIVLPVVISLWAICNLFIFWLRKPRSKSLISIAVLGSISVMSFVIEICMNMFYNGKLQIVISLAVTACCVSLMIFFAFLEKSKRLKAWAERKFFM
ncbi:MAG: hypothetical protein IJE19_01585 [Clostridia bacterium]|nr:hypothetical protein [Clostridia bacterium]